MVQKEKVFTERNCDPDSDIRACETGRYVAAERGDVDSFEGENVKPEVPVIQLGAGTVGRELIRKIKTWNGIEANKPRYLHVGIADKSGFVTNKNGFSERDLSKITEEKSTGEELAGIYPNKVGSIGSLESFLEGMESGVLIDVTDAERFEDLYRSALTRGWSVVLANKIPLTRIDSREFSRLKQSGLRYETTVGAGLPVISTLDHLRDHGEKFVEIAAILSGSLSFILSRLEVGVDLQQAVREAKDKGYTEPNPAEDLLGKDVARKAVILGRSLGLDFTLDDIELQPLVRLDNSPSSKLWPQLEAASSDLREKVKSAEGRDNRLRYVARINGQGASVGLEEVPESGPLGQGISTANVILFRTDNYDDPPLIVQGPGAGPEVTAGGVFSDIKRCRARCR